ncbi:hypothetical protein CASFOL_010373 [Castilleja foliolosa]|uniref:Uncharacterized protein n=1 Tax=Castilleja foliolosa TaxID=1961234 RepID=A0ABD3DSD5_9LAMI
MVFDRFANPILAIHSSICARKVQLFQYISIRQNMKYYLELCYLCSLVTILTGLLPSHGSMIRVLDVGEELLKETLLLQNGDCLYQLRGLRPHTWYEVKISYPASVPTSFSLRLSRGISDNLARKLLNTEKLIFKTNGMYSLGEMYVAVNVEPEGIVAIPGEQEREYVMFNIVCDERLMGISHKAWYIAVLVLLCLVFAFVVPSFLPPFLLPKNGIQPLHDPTVIKDS